MSRYDMKLAIYVKSCDMKQITLHFELIVKLQPLGYQIMLLVGCKQCLHLSIEILITLALFKGRWRVEGVCLYKEGLHKV